MWLEGRARRRGRGGGQPSGLDRDRITEVTVRLLDAEGLAKFSMRRLAAELNVTAMSVYWYVDTKDDLLELALDAAFGELDGPAGSAGRRRRLARRSCARWPRPTAACWSGTPGCRRSPARFLNIGPNALALRPRRPAGRARTGLPAYGVSGALSAVFQFVYGYGTIEGHFFARCRRQPA